MDEVCENLVILVEQLVCFNATPKAVQRIFVYMWYNSSHLTLFCLSRNDGCQSVKLHDFLMERSSSLCCRTLWCNKRCYGLRILLSLWTSTRASSEWRECLSLLDQQCFSLFIVIHFKELCKMLQICCRLLQKFDFPAMRFSLYFLGYEDKKEIPADVKERTAWTFSRRATIELTQ